MPTYVYKFIQTGETIEIQQAFTDDALTEAKHPADGTMRPVKKVFQPVGVTFKGGGFYKTDSKGSGGGSDSSTSSSSTSPASESSSSPAGESSGSASSDSSSSVSSPTPAAPAATPAP
ncbi:MAG: FmdB family transcriptional regulator [Actinobacteria bacterium]|nr:FmdB family transcriptional regulator [Actinomycetota bacterium]